MQNVVPLHKLRLEQDGRNRDVRLLEAVLARTHEAAAIYDAQPLGSAEARIIFVNAAYATLMGGAAARHIGKKPILFAADGNEGKTSGSGRHERSDGTSLALEMSLAPIEDERQRLNLVVAFYREAGGVSNDARATAAPQEKRTIGALRRELRARKRVEKILLEATCRDGLTGLPNRLLFLELVTEALSKTRRSGTSVAVLFVGCDRFKFVNDTYGHLAGDTLLLEVAERLHQCVRPPGVLARIGGDEFVVLLRGGNTLGAAATSLAQRLAKTFSLPFKLEGEEVYLSASIGLAVSSADDGIAEDLMRDADIAMHEAKHTGGQRCVVFSPDLRVGLVRHRTLETDLRRALERSELCIAYQPIVRLIDGRLMGFEALARWEHATLGSVTPTEFIAVAESSKLIVELGDWILHEACIDLRRWQQADSADASLCVSVNVSAKQLMDERFSRRVASALMQSGLRAESLRLELTESSLMVDSDMASALLGRLRAMGVCSHVDDFGTGYASLTYLQRFPVTALKIDRSFVSGCGDGLANPVIVKMIARLAADLGLRVVAEGIETAAQAQALTSLGCDYGQGYYFARPLAVSAVPAYLAERGGPEESRAMSLGGSTISRTGPA